MTYRMVTFLIPLLYIFFVPSYSEKPDPDALVQNSKIFESMKLESKILGKDVEYSVYLPYDYFNSDRSYPVLYLLHGFSDDETGWTQFGEVKHIADKAISSGDATEMIIVMPDAGVSWYVNNYDSSVEYENFFFEELIPHIESEYRARSGRQYRAVAGLSMGGFGSLVYGLRHPDKLSACAPLSAGVFTDDEIVEMPHDRWNHLLGEPFGIDLEGKDRISGNYKNYQYENMLNTYEEKEQNPVRFYIDCGDDDFLIKGNMALHAAMIDREIDHEFRVRDGGHSWSYWRSALPDVLAFISKSFHR
ncbi:alpha/beta hydrolase [Membranihabitans maritimus]|uniref:alpha/beta hydrolase n=1 Tax=Membranihabitans maritimus TaxID=2904244 RepID=UPI001F412097|nr:alpha/beta hydrolase family protein [Membranihabitans maritimus]